MLKTEKPQIYFPSPKLRLESENYLKHSNEEQSLRITANLPLFKESGEPLKVGDKVTDMFALYYGTEFKEITMEDERTFFVTFDKKVVDGTCFVLRTNKIKAAACDAKTNEHVITFNYNGVNNNTISYWTLTDKVINDYGDLDRKNIDNKEFFHFLLVEEFFKDFESWDKIVKVTSIEHIGDGKTRIINLLKSDGTSCAMVISIISGNMIRVQFNPAKASISDYPKGNTRSIVLDSFDELRDKICDDLEIHIEEDKSQFQWSVRSKAQGFEARVIVYKDPFSIFIYKKKDGVFCRVLMARNLYYCHNGHNEYSIIQSIDKPPTANYVGFGEHGGASLSKNSTQITFFNFDNMRYNQVYSRGPLEGKEPLYHTDPFFMEVNGIPDKSSTYGAFIDNSSEICMDIGHHNSSEYLIGTRFGDFDCYFILGDNCNDVIKSFSQLIGTARLKPRYALGYHQGCYGYEKRNDVEDTVNKYRQYQIPLDGMHIDVDIQKNYRTFTIDETKFNNPKEMFSNLRRKGVKCSTNITPIISNKCKTGEYSTYSEGAQKNYFVKDTRYDANDPDAKVYHNCSEGRSKYTYNCYDPENNFNSGKDYIGEVFYGGDRGSTGCYPDLGRKEVRFWWGQQYQNLFDMGLEMVWQDMTTPSIRETRGDMKSFPARLMVNNDYTKKVEEDIEDYTTVPVIKVWNLYSYNLHKATYHGLNNLKGRENKRNFIIGRGCFTGMQRFAGLWTGDNASNWDFLKINISQVLALGLTGQAICGQDIGGFEKAQDWEQWADPELLIRWTAMGAFLPWFRNHYIRKGSKKFQEPYEYQFVRDYLGEDNYNKLPEDVKYLYQCVLPICKYYIELRYRLLQLFYDAMFENCLNGLPICRALFLSCTEDKSLFNSKISCNNDQFFVRGDLLIAPILEKQSYENGNGKRNVYLPSGSKWYCFMDNKQPLSKPVDGGTTVTDFDAHISNEEGHIPFTVPIYVREGAIIPTVELEQYVGELHDKNLPNPIMINIYPGNEGNYTMYLDDGVSRSSAPVADIKYGGDPDAKGEYRETFISHRYIDSNEQHKVRQVTIERKYDNYTPEFEKYFYVSILLDQSIDFRQLSIKCNNEAMGRLYADDYKSMVKIPLNCYLIDSNANIIYIKLLDNDPILNLNIENVY